MGNVFADLDNNPLSVSNAPPSVHPAITDGFTMRDPTTQLSQNPGLQNPGPVTQQPPAVGNGHPITGPQQPPSQTSETVKPVVYAILAVAALVVAFI